MGASPALDAIGSLLKGFMAYSAGKAQERQLKYAAAQENADASVRAQAELDKLDRIEGEAAVRAAQNGGGFTGSTQDVLGDMDSRGVFNARSLIYQGATRGRNDLYQAKIARRDGALKLVGASVEAASSLASGWAQAVTAGATGGGGGGGK